MMSRHIRFLPGYLLVVLLLLSACSGGGPGGPGGGAGVGPGGGVDRPGGAGGGPGGGADRPGGAGGGGVDRSAGGGVETRGGANSRRGPGATGGVSLGGPGGGGPGGPASVGGVGGMTSAGFGGRGGGGGLGGPISPAGPGRGGPGGDVGSGGGAGRPGRGGDRLGPGGEVGSGRDNGPGSGAGLGPGGIGPGRDLDLSQLGGVVDRLPGGFTFGDGSLELPRSPAVLEQLDQGAAAQQAIQAAAEQGQQAVDQAIGAAQAAYEQLWTDYYEAVDYAAEAYYNAVTAAIDYGAESFADYYGQAVAQAQQAVDYYNDYYDDYQAYCALYPWDCYNYVYDETTSAYVPVEENTEAAIPVAEPVPQEGVAPPPVKVPAPSPEAYEAIVVFANDQLGAVVVPVYAGELTQETLDLLAANAPPEVQNSLYAAQSMGTINYYALLNGGVAALVLGDCSAGTGCQQLSGDLPADLSKVSLGVYSLQTAEAMPGSAGEALQLMTVVYPKLAGLNFVQVADVPGYAFSATTTSAALEAEQPTFVTKVVFAGVMDVNGRAVVYAAVGLGESHANLLNPFQ